MAFVFEELDDRTREHMLREFEAEEVANPYRGRSLSDAGREAFPDLIRSAIRSGNEEVLVAALGQDAYWQPTEPYIRGHRRVNVRQAAERLGQTEFNTWYVRGLCARLSDEGVETCEVYRAALPRWEVGACSVHEGKVFKVADVYAAHRASYWPEPGDPNAITIPFGPGCHHTIRRPRPL